MSKKEMFKHGFCNSMNLIQEDFVEEDLGGKTYRFCSSECADKYELRKEHV